MEPPRQAQAQSFDGAPTIPAREAAVVGSKWPW
ncbi:hypothetical protein NHJ13734_004361, partial [Beauveria thailandica]